MERERRAYVEGTVVEGTVVAHILSSVPGKRFEDCFHPAVAAQCRSCGKEVRPGWTYDGLVFAPPPEAARPGLEEARVARLAAIIAGADAAKAALSAGCSALEEASWPEQEAGARAITGATAAARHCMACFILTSKSRRAEAVFLVERLAEQAGVNREAFAARIIARAEAYSLAVRDILLKQRAHEAAARAAASLEELEDRPVVYGTDT